ncbi:MAG: ABC transporter ATP-binding protein/permease [Clostridia bacterium]|nr:ABC transporter ATP-binding protein/permease [Clostridia bacterium]
MIKVENLKKTYDKGTRRANEVLHNLSFELPDTGFICILGSSGCGKTSLLNAIGGLDVFDSGKIITENTEIKKATSREMERERNANFGYIFQNYYLLSEHSVAYNVYLGMHSLDVSHEEKLERVSDALSRVDMLRYGKRPVGELSGGQQQRVAIARAIARRPRVIFADEPTGNLDEANTMNICTILKELSKESLIVMVTHETRIANFFADRIITLDDGSIVSDTTDWSRGTIDAGEKDAIYAADYTEERTNLAKLSVRMLSTEDAEPLELTIVTEKDRIVFKFNDKRVVLSSELSSAPFLKEGSRPVLSIESFDNNEKQIKKEVIETKGNGKKFLGFKLIMKEAKNSVSGRKLRRFSLGMFIIILSLMLSLAIADFITVAHIDPEDFITDDSHTLTFNFSRGAGLGINVRTLKEEIVAYIKYLNESGIDFDYLPKTNTVLSYKDSTVEQLGTLAMGLSKYTYVDLSRLDEDTLIAGRMPEKHNEIVVDRWVLDKAISEEGILQNIIPNAEYFLGKKLGCDRSYTPTIVGICDSGEPAVYMSKEGLLAVGAGGYEVMTLSEFNSFMGTDITLSEGECICIVNNAGAGRTEGEVLNLKSGYFLTIRKLVSLSSNTNIKAKVVIRDEELDDLYYSMISSTDMCTLWTEDKDAIYKYLDAGVPEEMKGRLSVTVVDNYTIDYNEYKEKTMTKMDARTIVISSVILLSAVMLYLMQRSKIKDRMDIVTVYRLLGIPKRNLMLIFGIESLSTTFKYSLPTIAIAYGAIRIISTIEQLGTILIFPVWGALLTLGIIAAFRLFVAILPIFTLNRKPPARLAADYDF